MLDLVGNLNCWFSYVKAHIKNLQANQENLNNSVHVTMRHKSKHTLQLFTIIIVYPPQT